MPLRTGTLLLALLCGLPISFMAIYGLPWMAMASVAMLLDSPGVGAAHGLVYVFAATFALATYWRLAWCTAVNKKVNFGLAFWAALLAAVGATWELTRWFGGWEAPAFLVAPLVGSAMYFIRQQRVKAAASEA